MIECNMGTTNHKMPVQVGMQSRFDEHCTAIIQHQTSTIFSCIFHLDPDVLIHLMTMTIIATQKRPWLSHYVVSSSYHFALLMWLVLLLLIIPACSFVTLINQPNLLALHRRISSQAGLRSAPTSGASNIIHDKQAFVLTKVVMSRLPSEGPTTEAWSIDKILIIHGAIEVLQAVLLANG